jgi:hypothetical protein
MYAYNLLLNMFIKYVIFMIYEVAISDCARKADI